jgi:hypothetical protein
MATGAGPTRKMGLRQKLVTLPEHKKSLTFYLGAMA